MRYHVDQIRKARTKMDNRDRYKRLIERGDDAYEIIAWASGEKEHDDRWTVLTIYRRRESAPADYPGPFVAEIVGETRIVGEERRERRGAFDSVLEALGWGAFNAKSALYNELWRKAMGWLERHTLETGGALRFRLGGHNQSRLGRSVSRMQSTSYTEGQETRDQKALRLLRELVEAANSKDDDRLDRAISDASDFLEEIGDAARNR